MGLFSSEFKPYGQISNQRVLPQRTFSKTHFGELVLANQKTGKLVWDNIREDIMQGSTAKLRRYYKRGVKYGFTGEFRWVQDWATGAYFDTVQAETAEDIDYITNVRFGSVSGANIALAELSRDHGFYERDYDDNGVQAIGTITVNGAEQGITQLDGSSGTMVLTLTDGTTYDSGVHVPQGVTDIFFAEYVSGDNTYYFTTNSITVPPHSGPTDAGVYPIVPLQDNNNGELPYETLPWADDRWRKRDRLISRLGLNFSEMSRQVFSHVPELGSDRWNATYGNQWNNTPRLHSRYPTEASYHDFLAGETGIPNIGTPDWRHYERNYKEMKKECSKHANRPSYEILPETAQFCSDYPTEQDYHDSLVADKEQANQGIDNITDAHFGVFVSPKTLSYSNVISMYYTMKAILPNLVLSPRTIEYPAEQFIHRFGNDGHPEIYGFNFRFGSLFIDYEIADYSLCTRYGVADPIHYPQGKHPKYRHTGFTIADNSNDCLPFDSGARDESFGDTIPPRSDDHETMIELRIQMRGGKYLEMRLFGCRAREIVNVWKDSEFGRRGEVEIVGGVEGFHGGGNIVYSDVFVLPIKVDSTDMVPIFRRERLIRESLIIHLGAIRMQEVKWYERGIFQIIVVFISLVVAFYTAGGGSAGLVAVIETAVTTLVLKMLIGLIDNPYLKALVTVIAIAYGAVDGGTLASDMSLLVEATGVVLKAKLEMDMIELKEKVKEFRHELSEQQEEFDKMKEEVGQKEITSEWLLYIASLAPVEYPDDFFERALNKNLNEVTPGELAPVVPVLPTPQF